MPVPLNDRVAIVTGASSGIGAATAKALALEGCKVVLAARRADKLAEVAGALAAQDLDARAQPTDVTDEAQVEALFRSARDWFGGVDILVNAAGIADHTPIEDLPLARWREVLDANLTSAFLCAKAAMRIMKPQGRGRIINIGSISAKSPRHDAPAYSASKYGLDGLTRWLALDGRAHGVSACILHPGFTVTDLAPELSRGRPPGAAMPADEVARLVVVMASVPDEMNVLEAVALPLSMPFLGRG